MALNGEIEPSVANVVMQADKWLSAKFYPKMFGDKTDITSGGEKIQSAPTTIQVEITRPDED